MRLQISTWQFDLPEEAQCCISLFVVDAGRSGDLAYATLDWRGA
jgi:hypothetical protein